MAVKKLAFLLCWLCSLAVLGAEVIPPMPAQYFNDYAHVVPATTATELDTKLRDFERATSDQVVVAIYPKMQSDSSIDDYTVRVARAWRAGQALKNNGVVLFVFIQDRQMFIQVGYGLEAVLPDALCKQITEFEIKPRFKTGDYAGGLTAGVNAILAATRHEYKGTGTTVLANHASHSQNLTSVIVFIIFVAFVLLQSIFGRRRGWLYSSGGWGGYSGGGGSSGGGGFSGGFSGGGGSFGGGGAGSSW
jgi:uncharacterized protein